MVIKHLEKIDKKDEIKEEPTSDNFDDISLFDVSKDDSNDFTNSIN